MSEIHSYPDSQTPSHQSTASQRFNNNRHRKNHRQLGINPELGIVMGEFYLTAEKSILIQFMALRETTPLDFAVLY